jgi:cytochrome P450
VTVAYPGAPGLDLLSPAATEDPYASLAPVRAASPVSYSEVHRAWLLTGHQVTAWGYTARQLSSDRIRPLLARGEIGPDSARIMEMMRDWMVLSDPPAHTRLRRTAAAAFKSRRIAQLGEHITARVDSLLDEFIATGQRDLIEHVTHPLPGSVIAELLGAPPADSGRFREWSDELALVAFGTGGEHRDDRHVRALHGLEEMFGYFRELIGAARSRPGDNMISVLLDSRVPGVAPLDDDEILSMSALLLFAGHETTINSIANGVLALLTHPAELARLTADLSLVPAAVEEILRWDGPIKLVVRWITEEAEVDGNVLRPGQRAYLVNAAANRDPGVFDHAGEFDITRSPNPHLAFGRGMHACIGAQLARLEMRVALERIVTRLPGLRLAQPVQWHSSLASRALTALPVEYDGTRP